MTNADVMMLRRCTTMLMLMLLLLRSNCGLSSVAANRASIRQLGGINLLKMAIAREDNRRITQISVIGERHSGTNFMLRTLKENIAPDITVSDWFCANKHKFQAKNKLCPPLNETLVVVMLRNPFDWAFGMYKQCYCPLDTEGSKGSFEEFMRKPWRDNSDKFWWPDPKTRAWCDTLMQCRAVKYLNFLNLTTWTPHVVFVRHEDVITHEEAAAWLAKLVAHYQLPLQTEEVKPSLKYKGSVHLFFNSSATKSRSIWFNKHMAFSNETLLAQVQLVAGLMDKTVESIVGYGVTWRLFPHSWEE